MDIKDELKNKILVDMKRHLDNQTLTILEQVIIKNISGIKMDYESALATMDNTNDYIIQLFNFKKAPKLSPKTTDYYLTTVNKFLDFKPMNLTDVSTSDIEAFLYSCSLNGLSATTLNNYLRNLSAFYLFMRKNNLVIKNPCESIEAFPEVVKPIEHIEAVDMDIIRKTCKTPKQRALLEFLRSTATRRGEVPNIKVGDVDFSTGKITILGGKNRKYRTVYLDSLAKNYLQIYLNTRKNYQKSEPLFTIRGKKEAMDEKHIYDIIRYLSKKSGVRIYPHLLRKTTATNICRRGGSEEAAGEYLGHTPQSVTRKHYTYRGDEYIEEIFKKFVDTV